MFLLERLLGVCSYMVVSFSGFFAIKKAQKKWQIHLIFLLVLVVLTIMAYFFVPTEYTDLYRWTEYMHIYRLRDIKTFFSFAITRDTPGSHLYIYLISKLNNDRLLPAITNLIVYSLIFYIFLSASSKNKISSNGIAYTFLAFMCAGRFLEIISYIRFFIAALMIAVCVYREIYLKRFNVFHLLLYAAAISFHTFSIVLIGLRLVLLLFKMRWYISLIIVSIAASLLVLFSVLFSQQFASFISKVVYYLFDTSYVYVWEYIISALWLLLLCFLMLNYYLFVNNKKNNNDYLLLIAVLLVSSFVFCFIYTVFQRLVSFVFVVSLPVLMVVFDNKINQRMDIPIKTISILIILAICILACSRGNLCAYKYFII